MTTNDMKGDITMFRDTGHITYLNGRKLRTVRVQYGRIDIIQFTYLDTPFTVRPLFTRSFLKNW